MKIAIDKLKWFLRFQRDDIKLNKAMLKDNENSPEMCIYLSYEIEKNKSAIASLKKALAVLKNFKS